MLDLHYEIKGIVVEGSNVRILMTQANKLKKPFNLASLKSPQDMVLDMMDTIRPNVQYDSITVPFDVWADKKPNIGDVIILSMRLD